jgi:hypothetical protein
MFDMLATRHFLTELLAEKAVRKGRADVAVIGMRVDARTRAAAELERFFAGFDLRCWPTARHPGLCPGDGGRHDAFRPAAAARRARPRAVRAFNDWVEAG